MVQPYDCSISWMKMGDFSPCNNEMGQDNQRVNYDGVQHRKSQGLKLSEKWFFRRCQLAKQRYDTLPIVHTVRDDETQTSEPWSRDTRVPRPQVQGANRIVICMTSDKPETEKPKPLENSDEEESRVIRPDSQQSCYYENSSDNFRSPTLCTRSSPDSSGAPNDAYECLFDIVKDCGNVSGIKHPAAIREYNSYRVCKDICDYIFANTCLQTDPAPYQMAVSDPIRANLLTTKCSNNVERNITGSADVRATTLPAKSSVKKSLNNTPNKSSLKFKRKITSNIPRGMKLIAVRRKSRKRKKVAKVDKKKTTFGDKKASYDKSQIMRENDDKQFGPVKRVENIEGVKKSYAVFVHEQTTISTPSDDYAVSSVSRKEMSSSQSTGSKSTTESINEVIAEPALATCSSKCRGIMPTKCNHSGKNKLKPESRVLRDPIEPLRKDSRLAKKESTIKTPETNSLQSNNEEWKENPQKSKRSPKVREAWKERSAADQIDARKMQNKRKSLTTSEIVSINESMNIVEKSSDTIRDKDDRTYRSFCNGKISSRRPRARQMSSVMTLWHWLRGRYCSDGTAVSTSTKLRTPSSSTESSGHDAKDPFLSLLFPVIMDSNVPTSMAERKPAAKIYHNLAPLIKARNSLSAKPGSRASTLARMYEEQRKRKS